MNKTSAPYRFPARLLALYRAIAKYREENFESPTMREIISMGLASSPSMVSYYYDQMEKMGMIEFTHKNGRRKGIKLLDLQNAHPRITALLNKESQ